MAAKNMTVYVLPYDVGPARAFLGECPASRVNIRSKYQFYNSSSKLVGVTHVTDHKNQLVI